MCKRFNEVAENGSVSDALCNLVMDGLNELQIKIDAHHGSKEIQEYQQNGKNKDMVLKQGKMVLSPISVRRRGRPPSLRKQSKLDQVVRRLRMKKQQESTIEVQSRRRRKTRTKNVISKDKQLINIQNSRQMEVIYLLKCVQHILFSSIKYLKYFISLSFLNICTSLLGKF